jgi:hypothetical protein
MDILFEEYILIIWMRAHGNSDLQQYYNKHVQMSPMAWSHAGRIFSLFTGRQREVDID